MTKTLTERQPKKALAKEAVARIAAAQAATRAVVATGICPDCGTRLRRNMSLTGWWQCAQLGAVGFRLDPTKPACNWQGFTE